MIKVHSNQINRLLHVNDWNCYLEFIYDFLKFFFQLVSFLDFEMHRLVGIRTKDPFTVPINWTFFLQIWINTKLTILLQVFFFLHDIKRSYSILPFTWNFLYIIIGELVEDTRYPILFLAPLVIIWLAFKSGNQISLCIFICNFSLVIVR